MKTKIIYISGSEVFEMADVRAAFEEVRATLGLGRDTVLFGVPVDNDDALAQPVKSVAAPVAADLEASNDIADNAPAAAEEIINTESEIVSETDIISAPVPTEIESEIIEPAVTQTEIKEKEAAPEQEEVPGPVKKSRGRPRKIAPAAAVSPAPADESKSEKVIPILSVLSANTTAVETVTDEPAPAAEIAEPVATDDPVVATTDATESITDVAAEKSEFIDDLITDQVPEEPVEKTLEQLLESMTPLREDHGATQESATVDEAVDMGAEYDAPETDTDATLEQLAAEFADTQDKIAAPAPAPTHGKIGKLKNILPFKKARRDDTGLMGDLFGWAGVAANDEDFSIPGFFTTAAKK